MNYARHRHKFVGRSLIRRAFLHWDHARTRERGRWNEDALPRPTEHISERSFLNHRDGRKVESFCDKIVPRQSPEASQLR